MELKGEQVEQLRVALQRAFPDKAKLRRLLREELDTRLDEIVGGQTLEDVVAELLIWAESEGKLPALVSAAIKRNPGNPRLRLFVESFGILPAEATPISTLPYGPDFEWRGPTEKLDLQGLLRPKPQLWDVAFLSRGVDQAASVCRIDMEGHGAIGTGFLISQDLILTNHHVWEDATRLGAISQLSLSFGCMTSKAGRETIGQTFNLAEQQPIRFSPTHKFDYALFRVESRILETKSVRPVNYIQQPPGQGSSIHVLQHPDGEAMKIVFGTNGITGVYADEGLIQYISQTSTGSSGSPCFNDDWHLVALHHAQRATTFGVVCEGILFSSIYPQISDVLS
ncbi:hypothetical protein BST81_26320 [Leptolyngbya sp. 'hensonii']|uniref:effector-associated domain EAD1-containing protein n=1 Tax=Leptolyngbya sp. 'hensonii' TaxID=1922337 RepID=UPI00094FEF56|nr:effector-associated domain EAD1-containing protein [Leptolyngbya sp. 'hensonii']OLP15450.1 hypothetical protein BST81_26320 [Leptolyngbya sp. 'hensonii']